MAGARRVLGVAGAALLLSLMVSGCLWRDVSTLADDTMAGRRAGTAGAATARRFLIDRLSRIAEPIHPELAGDDQYLYPFTRGVNVMGVIPGTTVPDEYVLIGAHYDGLGSSCSTSDPDDRICNGATDNATGVAAALALADDLAANPGRRSVIIALWDAEEAGLLGSAAYVANPVIPMSQTVSSINFDIQGANLLPSLRNTSFAVGAESGGASFSGLVREAVNEDTLDTTQLSAVFGAYRSDYVNTINAKVPTVFFTDSTGPCYHKASDDLAAVDFPKLDRQVAIAKRVMRGLVDADEAPPFSAAPLATYDDLLAIVRVVDRSAIDIERFTPQDQATLRDIRADLHALRDEGRAAFDNADVGVLLTASNSLISINTHLACDAFLVPPPPLPPDLTTTTTTTGPPVPTLPPPTTARP